MIERTLQIKCDYTTISTTLDSHYGSDHIQVVPKLIMEFDSDDRELSNEGEIDLGKAKYKIKSKITTPENKIRYTLEIQV